MIPIQIQIPAKINFCTVLESIPKSDIYHGYDSDSDSSKKLNHNSSSAKSNKLRNVLVFVQLIHRPTRTENQLNKTPNIAQLVPFCTFCLMPNSEEHLVSNCMQHFYPRYNLQRKRGPSDGYFLEVKSCQKKWQNILSLIFLCICECQFGIGFSQFCHIQS